VYFLWKNYNNLNKTKFLTFYTLDINYQYSSYKQSYFIVKILIFIDLKDLSTENDLPYYNNKYLNIFILYLYS
jgi:hypothetical protein